MKTKTDGFQEKLLILDRMLEECNAGFAKEAVEFQGELDLAAMEQRISVPDYENMAEQNIENTSLFSKRCKCYNY